MIYESKRIFKVFVMTKGGTMLLQNMEHISLLVLIVLTRRTLLAVTSIGPPLVVQR